MAFVYKSEKKLKESSDNFENIGPGKYLTHQEYKFKETNVPFLSSSERLAALQKEKLKKDPNIDLALTTNFVNSQIHMQMLSESLHTIGKKKVESKPENGVFKSSSRRFEPEYKIENFPGPGAYVSSSSKPNNEKKEPRKKENFVEKNTIIDEIMNQGNYQPVPSIPSNIHCLGYADLECFLNNKRLLFFMISNRQFFS
jgi:hypothetical protein